MKKTINEWNVEIFDNVIKKLSIKNPVMIEGMPGIGNVGKITMDLLIEETKAKLIMVFYSKKLPNSVFVNEKNLIDAPSINLYHFKLKSKDFLFLTGDVQPTDELSCYDFCEIVADYFKEFKGQHIVTLGGIGLAEMPENPKVYITGNSSKIINWANINAKKNKIDKNIYGVVGPIMGVSGVLLGVSKRKNVDAFSLLAETFGHPMYIGLKGSKAIISVLSELYGFKISTAKIDKEITSMDKNIKGTDDDKLKKYSHPEVNYIG